jgi:CBS domain-containing protein
MNETVGSIFGRKGREIWSVAPDATVYDAVALMAAKSVGAVLVISQGSLSGIVSERDYARKVILQGRSSKETQVRDIMTTGLVTVTPDASVDDCMKIMTYNRIRHLPVLDPRRASWHRFNWRHGEGDYCGSGPYNSSVAYLHRGEVSGLGSTAVSEYAAGHLRQGSVPTIGAAATWRHS